MSSLFCAIAAQITAFLLSAMPMHPKQNLAAANRYGAPLFLRKSHQRFSLPFLCSAIRDGAVLCHRSATLCFSFSLPVCASQCRCDAVGRSTLPLHSSSPHSLRRASQRQAMPLLCLSLPHDAMPLLRPAALCLCFAKRRSTSPCPAVAAPSVAFAHLLKSRQCRCNANHCCAAQSHRTANRTHPCRCQAVHRTASASQGRQCHAVALSPSPHKRCR